VGREGREREQERKRWYFGPERSFDDSWCDGRDADFESRFEGCKTSDES
jgi:hypothetical protein